MGYRAGFCQFKPKLMDIDENLNRLKQMLSDVPADLIVLPELALSGYVFQNKQELIEVSEEAYHGKTSRFFLSLAAEFDVSFIVGFPEFGGTDEKDSPIIYNSCFLANPDATYYVYRKTHLFNRETLYFTSGESGLQVFPAKGGVKIGMMICFDWIFPESAGTLAYRGAQIICHPANLVLPWCQQAMITRSVENRIFTITANRVGKEGTGELEMTFTGQSQITTPKGEILKRLDTTEEAVWIETINPFEADNKMVTEYNHIFKDRRPDKYF